MLYREINELKAAVAAECAAKEHELERAKTRRRAREAAEAHAKDFKAKK